MRKLVYWVCGGCGETLQGIVNKDGDFISDKELDRQSNPRYQSVGCYLCGAEFGEVTGEVE
jgi:hypothetical protein